MRQVPFTPIELRKDERRKLAKLTKDDVYRTMMSKFPSGAAENSRASVLAYALASNRKSNYHIPSSWFRDALQFEREMQHLKYASGKLSEMVYGDYTAPFLDRLGSAGWHTFQKRFHRVPKKREAKKALDTWTSSTYKFIQEHLRKGASYNAMKDVVRIGRPYTNVNLSNALRNGRWLQTLMTKFALRAPSTPLRAPTTPLYRGVQLSAADVQKLLAGKHWPDKGFMSFTRNEDYAVSFGSRPTHWKHGEFVLFRLRPGDVARGTPWLWFVGEAEQAMYPRIRRWSDLGWYDDGPAEESEVTLPPGHLTVKRAQRQTLMATRSFGRGQENQNTSAGPRPVQALVVDVSFTPAPEYAHKPRRKGVRESNDNILWNVFANQPAQGRTRARSQVAAPSAPPAKIARRSARLQRR